MKPQVTAQEMQNFFQLTMETFQPQPLLVVEAEQPLMLALMVRGNIEASVVNLGSGYNVGDQLRISGSSIGGGSDLILTIGAATVSINQTDAGSGYSNGESIKILGNLIGGSAGADDIALSVGDANISISLANAGTSYSAGDVITIPGNLIGGTAGAGPGGDDISVTVGDANISVSVNTLVAVTK